MRQVLIILACPFAWLPVSAGAGCIPDQYGGLVCGEGNDAVRVFADGAVLAKLGGEYWATGEAIANRYEQLAAWSPDSRAVVEVGNSRWDSDAFAYYAIDGDAVTKVDLRGPVGPALKARLPAGRRESYSFRVRQEMPVKLDAKGRLSFTVMLYVPKSDPIFNYAVAVGIGTTGGRPQARIVSVRRVTADPRL